MLKVYITCVGKISNVALKGVCTSTPNDTTEYLKFIKVFCRTRRATRSTVIGPGFPHSVLFFFIIIIFLKKDIWVRKPDPGDVRARSESWPLASLRRFVLVLCLGEDELYQPQPGESEGGRQS